MKRRKRNDVRNVGFVLLIALIMSLFGLYKRDKVDKKGVYSIATIISIHYGVKGVPILDFTYAYMGKKYKGGGIVSRDIARKTSIGDRFFIQFLPDNPDDCYITDYRVPDFITESPYAGWASIREDWKIVIE